MDNKVNFAPFDGDGRVKQYPPAIRFLQTGRPVGMTNAKARQLIELFARHGLSNHSPQLCLLGVVVAWWQHHNTPFVVWYWEPGGYSFYLDKIPAAVSQNGGREVFSGR